jgi:hypothetical protein
MKQIEAVIYMGLEDQFQEVIEQEKIDEYFVTPRVIGKLRGTDPKLDTHVWPGYFAHYKFCIDDEKYESFRKRVEDKKDEWVKEGFLLMVNEIEERCGGCS